MLISATMTVWTEALGFRHQCCMERPAEHRGNIACVDQRGILSKVTANGLRKSDLGRVFVHLVESLPDKRGNRPSEVLLHISGKATYQELATYRQVNRNSCPNTAKCVRCWTATPYRACYGRMHGVHHHGWKKSHRRAGMRYEIQFKDFARSRRSRSDSFWHLHIDRNETTGGVRSSSRDHRSRNADPSRSGRLLAGRD